MEIYVVYSLIIFFSILLIFYIYLFYVKIVNWSKQEKIKKYNKKWSYYIDKLLIELDTNYPSINVIGKLRKEFKNKIRREIAIERIVYFSSSLNGSIRSDIKRFSEDTRLVEYVLREFKTRDKLKIALNCKILGEFRSQKAIPKLLYSLSNKFPDIKYNALMSIAKIGNLDAFVEGFLRIEDHVILSERSLVEIVDSFEGDFVSLYKKMISENNNFIATIFIKSLANKMDSQFNKDLVKLLNQNNKDKKIAVIKTLGQTSDLRYIQEIIDCVEDDAWEVRAVAATSLGKMEDSRALPALVKALTDREWWVRHNAAQAIFKIPNGIKEVNKIFDSQDFFAIDSMIYAMEVAGMFSEIHLYESSVDLNKRELAKRVNEYISRPLRKEVKE